MTCATNIDSDVVLGFNKKGEHGSLGYELDEVGVCIILNTSYDEMVFLRGVLREVVDLEVKEMPLREKYDRLLDEYLLSIAMGYALHKELGVVDKAGDLWVKVQRNMYPGYLGMAMKVLKAITPGKAFKQAADRYFYYAQTFNPLSNLEVVRVSDRETVTRVKNCVFLKRMKDLVKKAGLDIDPKFICEADSKIMPALAKEFGIDITMSLEENGCRATAKLR